jgi:hypothetical protein
VLRHGEKECTICVETDEPFAVAVYQLGTASIKAGMRQMDEALERYKRCLETGRYPGYPELIQSIDVPRWALRTET